VAHVLRSHTFWLPAAQACGKVLLVAHASWKRRVHEKHFKV
jgi:hypothetical protein